MENKAAQMDKVYNPQAIEGELYKEWEETGAFVAHRVEGKQPFTIVMPPPNITGQLHMGHAMDGVLQDSLTRYHRMKGDPTLWLPGTDHASIATEVKIVEAMRKEGLDKHDVGREEFLRRSAPDDLLGECLLPVMVDRMIREGALDVRVLDTPATWFGVTYKEDRPNVVRALKKLHEQGVY